MSGRDLAASQAVWKAMNVLPTPPRLLQNATSSAWAPWGWGAAFFVVWIRLLLFPRGGGDGVERLGGAA